MTEIELKEIFDSGLKVALDLRHPAISEIQMAKYMGNKDTHHKIDKKMNQM